MLNLPVMKKYTLLLIALLAFIFISGCDKIDPPYVNTPGDNGGGEEELVQKVLLEDYTGHTCVNCPAAAKLAGDLKQLYGEKLIIMAVHAGYFAEVESPPFDLDLRTQTGNSWNADFGVISYPSGMINRGFFGDRRVVGKGDWAPRVATAVGIDPKAGIEIETTYNESDRKLEIKIDSRFLENTNENYFLQVCLLEDSIPGAQRNNDASVGDTPTITDYFHRHVLRKGVNGNYGEAVTAGAIVANENYTHEYSLNLNADYKAKHCSVIAFLYRTSDNEILQVEERHILE